VLVYGDIPPEAITEIYAAAKGISLSKARALSPAFIDGVTINIIITKNGAGTRKIRGINLKKYRRIMPAMLTGIVSKAQKNIIET